MGPALSGEALTLLFLAASLASFIDVIAGGGLITIQTMLLTQIPPYMRSRPTSS